MCLLLLVYVCMCVCVWCHSCFHTCLTGTEFAMVACNERTAYWKFGECPSKGRIRERRSPHSGEETAPGEDTIPSAVYDPSSLVTCVSCIR